MSKIKKITKEKKYNRIFKMLSKYLLEPSRYNSYLDRLVNIDEDSFILRRMYLMIMNNRNIVLYLNEYLNNKFDNYKLRQYLKTFSHITNHNIHHQSNFAFVKSGFNSTYNKFASELLKYRPDLKPSYVIRLFRLHENGMLSELTLKRLKEENTLNEEHVIIKDEVITTEVKRVEFRDYEKSINEKAEGFKRNRFACQSCPLFKNKMTAFRSNVNSDEDQVHLKIIGDYPPEGNSNVENLLLELLNKLDEEGYKYTYINLYSCENNDPYQKEIVKTCIEIKDILLKINNHKLIVLMGGNVKKEFGIKGSIASLIGTVQFNKYFIHESIYEAIQNQTKYKRFQKGTVALFEYLDKNKNNMQLLVKEIHQSQYNIPESQLINSPNKDVSLFNIQCVNNDLIYVFIDKSFNKYYMIKPINEPVYIKYGNLQDNAYISGEEMDAVIYVSKAEKQKLTGILNKEIANYLIL